MKMNTSEMEHTSIKTIRGELQSIRNLSAYGDDKKQSEFLIKKADAIYLRYLQYYQ